MTQVWLTETLPITEPVPVQDMVVSGWAVQDCGHMVCLLGYLDQPNATGQMERVLKARIFQAKEDYTATLQCLAPLFLEAVRGKFADANPPLHVWDGYSTNGKA